MIILHNHSGFRQRPTTLNSGGVRSQKIINKKAESTLPRGYSRKDTDGFDFITKQNFKGYTVEVKEFKNKSAYDLYDFFKTQRSIPVFPTYEKQIEMIEDGKIETLGMIIFPFLVFQKAMSDTRRFLGVYKREIVIDEPQMVFRELSLPIHSFSVIELVKKKKSV